MVCFHYLNNVRLQFVDYFQEYSFHLISNDEVDNDYIDPEEKLIIHWMR
jgi:hypothetical protein